MKARQGVDKHPRRSVRLTSCKTALYPFTAMTPKFPLVENMRQYGGNFASKLADAMVAADPDNFKILVEAFPQIVEKYSKPVNL